MAELQQEASTEDVKRGNQESDKIGTLDRMVRTFDFMQSIMGSHGSVLNREGNLF